MKQLLIIPLLALTLGLFAQNKISEAFAKSYKNEYAEQYALAAKDIEAVYDDASYEMNFRLGWLYYMVQDYPRAAKHYKKAVAIRTSSIEARMGYVMPVAAMENWEEVIATYKEVLNRDPNHSVVNYRMAYLHNERKQYAEALKYAQKVASMYPFDFDNNFLLGGIYVSLGKIAEAKEHYNKALIYNPGSSVVLKKLESL